MGWQMITDHAKRQEYLDEFSDMPKWTLYASVSFGALFVFGNLIFMLIG